MIHFGPHKTPDDAALMIGKGIIVKAEATAALEERLPGEYTWRKTDDPDRYLVMTTAAGRSYPIVSVRRLPDRMVYIRPGRLDAWRKCFPAEKWSSLQVAHDGLCEDLIQAQFPPNLRLTSTFRRKSSS